MSVRTGSYVGVGGVLDLDTTLPPGTTLESFEVWNMDKAPHLCVKLRSMAGNLYYALSEDPPTRNGVTIAGVHVLLDAATTDRDVNNVGDSYQWRAIGRT